MTEQKKLPSDSVHCVVTSPPYWNGMRDYKTPPIVWDDPGGCDHAWGVGPGRFCEKCSAWEGNLGDEPTVQLYIKHLVDVFHETYRILHHHGQMFINISDSRANRQWAGVPWRLALALQEDGWRWEDEIIWVKDNYSPGSHTNRTVRAHEVILVMNKNKNAYWDQFAIREKSSSPERERRIRELIKGMGDGQYNLRSIGRNGQAEPGKDGTMRSRQARIDASAKGFRNRCSVWEISAQPFTLEMCRACKQVYSRSIYTQLSRNDDDVAICRCGSTDWVSHFATFPEDLVRLCVMVGSSERGCCPKCLSPWERIIEKRFVKLADRMPGRRYARNVHRQLAAMDVNSRDEMGFNELRHVGWKPRCDCTPGPPVPCTVLDLFGGSGTTAKIAQETGREWILIELQEDYIPLIEYRVSDRQEVLRLG